MEYDSGCCPNTPCLAREYQMLCKDGQQRVDAVAVEDRVISVTARGPAELKAAARGFVDTSTNHQDF
eukprot:6039605-Alexandrium_andersonii.AAC.1